MALQGTLSGQNKLEKKVETLSFANSKTYYKAMELCDATIKINM